MSHRRRARWLLATGLLLAACRTGGGEPEPQRPGPEERRQDIEACVEGLAGPDGVQDDVRACDDLWLDERCRDSWTAALSLELGERGEYVIRECMSGYCPEAAPPRPQLCEHDPDTIDLLDDEPDWMALWSDFNAVVLSRDLNLDRGDERGALIARRLLQLIATSVHDAERDADDESEFE